MENMKELCQALLDGKTLKNNLGIYLTLENSQAIYIDDPRQWNIHNKWKMEPAKWWIMSTGEVSRGTTKEVTRAQEFGMKYHTKEAAEKARDEMREANLLRYWTSVIDPKWEADWGNVNQDKWFIYKTKYKKYEYDYSWVSKGIGTVYMSEETARKICEKLNNGELKL